jgi:hypothetical protein
VQKLIKKRLIKYSWKPHLDEVQANLHNECRNAMNFPFVRMRIRQTTFKSGIGGVEANAKSASIHPSHSNPLILIIMAVQQFNSLVPNVQILSWQVCGFFVPNQTPKKKIFFLPNFFPPLPFVWPWRMNK